MRKHLARFLQTILLSLAFGALIGFARYSLPIYSSAENVPGITPSQFITFLTFGGPNAVRDLTIYPTLDGKNYVRGTLVLPPNRTRAFQFNATNPFKFGPIPGKQDIRAFLARNYPKISYRYAWWIAAAAQGLFWGSGGAVLFAIVFVIAKSRMAGMGETPQVNLLAGFEQQSAPLAPPPTPSLAEAAKLADLNAELEASLRNQSTDVAENLPATESQPIPVLSGTAQPAPQFPENQEPKDYQGDFYPVARSAKPKE